MCSHARSAASVKHSLQAEIDMICHASFIDEEGMDMLEQAKDTVFVAPTTNFPLASCQGGAIPFGLTLEIAAKKGLKHEVEVACKAMQ